MGKVIVIAVPIFVFLMLLEWAWSQRFPIMRQGTRIVVYRLSDTFSSLTLGLISLLQDALTKVITLGIYSVVFHATALFPDMAFWSTWYGFVVALVMYDFFFYWLHRADHEVALLWASHVVHHQSQHFNLSTALRQSSSSFLFSWIFYLPMAVLGVPPVIFAAVAIVDLLYQFWVHTELVGKLGWFDRVFCSPSNHRVHHAVNDCYVDRNYGGILMVWDHWFGTFQEETEVCVYGTRSPLRSCNPLWANVQVYWTLLQDTWRTRRWVDKWRLWFKAPGWQPDDLAQTSPKPPFSLQSVTLYDPPLNRLQRGIVVVTFTVMTLFIEFFLWNVSGMSSSERALWVFALIASGWVQSLYLQGQLSTATIALQQGVTVSVLLFFAATSFT